jgi:hypothetical protein
MEFQYQVYDFENCTVLEEMFEECFGTKPSAGYFEWKYKLNPAGKAIALVAQHNGQIAAFYGVIPEYYIINGKKELIYQSMDTMTHPDFQRKGLFTKLANQTYDHIRATTGKLTVFGFPGETSYPGFIKKLDWSTLIECNYQFTNKHLFKFRNLGNKISKHKIKPVQDFDEEFDQYFRNKIYDPKPISKYLDQAVLNWRFCDSPMMKYQTIKISEDNEIKGFVIYRIDEKNRIFIICMDFIDSKNISIFIKSVLRFLFTKIQPRAIYTFQSSTDSIKEELKRNGFISNPFSKGPFSYRTPIIIYGDRQVNKINVFDVKNWDIQPYLRDY